MYGGLPALLAAGALLTACSGPAHTGAQASSGGPSPTAAGPSAASPGPSGLARADSASPTASACGKASGPWVVVELNPAAPAPRCVQVQPGQRLRVVNTSDRDEATGHTATVRFAGLPERTVALHKATTFDRELGDYLAPGVHRLEVSIYPGGGAEIWLRR